MVITVGLRGRRSARDRKGSGEFGRVRTPIALCACRVPLSLPFRRLSFPRVPPLWALVVSPSPSPLGACRVPLSLPLNTTQASLKLTSLIHISHAIFCEHLWRLAGPCKQAEAMKWIYSLLNLLLSCLFCTIKKNTCWNQRLTDPVSIGFD